MQQDQVLEAKIAALRRQIKNWVLKHELWHDSCFHSALEYYDDEPDPSSPCLTVLHMSDKLREVMLGPYSSITDQLNQILEDNSCWMDNNGYTLSFNHWNDDAGKDFADYLTWQWMVDLVKPDYTVLYQELFSYFNSSPDRFHDLSPRKFEILMYELLKQKGYEAILGPGTNDQGVDITLNNQDLISPVKTLVQVKRYAQKYAINLQAVSSLYGTLIDQDPKGNSGHKALFITSSYFLPSAIRFAARHSSVIELADKKDITAWSFKAATDMEANLQRWLSVEHVSELIQGRGKSLAGKIVYTDVIDGIKDTIYPKFYIILKDSTNACLIMELPTTIIEKQYSTGYIIPNLALSQCLQMCSREFVFRVKKIMNDEQLSFRGQRRIYMLWDGQSRVFIGD